MPLLKKAERMPQAGVSILLGEQAVGSRSAARSKEDF
jgi:hypothetical protein